MFEVFYPKYLGGGHSGPFQTFEEARQYAHKWILGCKEASFASIVDYSDWNGPVDSIKRHWRVYKDGMTNCCERKYR